MQIGFVGLGKMGLGMASRLVAAGHEVFGYDRDSSSGRAAAAAKVTTLPSLETLVYNLSAPRVVWLMLPAGEATRDAVAELGGLLHAGDVIVDGGNSYYRDAAMHAATLARDGIGFVDVGTSGGVRGETHGFCLMIGGAPAVAERLAPLFESLAIPGGWARLGPNGAGHFAKMVHNGIEYGVMQAYAEGFAMLEAKHDLDIDLAEVAAIWQNGSVIRSWLLDLIAETFANDQTLADIAPRVADSGEGRWAVQEAVDLNLPAPVITAALLARLGTREPRGFAARLLAAMRQRFGGHAIEREGPNRE
ncbi:MAG: decarboxylating 6-phosphogluconate dehydrogenase [Gammaproteobacteria bacterium]|nr:decarboxylating 6-phosphogluconate dehydrogenase [Gammaproteobacteria bacterium]